MYNIDKPQERRKATGTGGIPPENIRLRRTLTTEYLQLSLCYGVRDRMDSPCVAGKMKAGRCGHTAYTARCTESACSAYHPELYAPELYARAFDLYAKRKADEKEWAEFHPAATIMRYCRQLAAPAPYWEPPTYKTGSCCFCGQLRVLPFAAPTQAEADQYATDKCDCEIGKARRRRREEGEIIAGLFAEFEPDTLRLLGTIADIGEARLYCGECVCGRNGTHQRRRPDNGRSDGTGLVFVRRSKRS